MIYDLITPLCRTCLTPSPQQKASCDMPQLSNRKLPLNKTLAWRWPSLTQGWRCTQDGRKSSPSCADSMWGAFPPDLVGQGTTMLISTGTGLLNTSSAAWKIWKKTLTFLYFCLKAFGSSWFRTYSGLHQFHNGCNGCKIAKFLLFEKNATFIHKESPILDASGVLKCLRPHSLGWLCWFKGEIGGTYRKLWLSLSLALPWVPSGGPIYDTWFLLRSKVPSPSTPGTNYRSLFPCPVMLDDGHFCAEAWLVTCLEKL